MSYYSPHTFEHIQTDNPADWMGATDVDVPEYDSKAQGCFWRGDHWEVVPGGPSAVTEEEMRQAEIEPDKKYLADTDWIISKISEASLTGQDTEPLLIQYDAQIKEREMARVRIRIAEGKL